MKTREELKTLIGMLVARMTADKKTAQPRLSLDEWKVILADLQADKTSATLPTEKQIVDVLWPIIVVGSRWVPADEGIAVDTIHNAAKAVLALVAQPLTPPSSESAA